MASIIVTGAGTPYAIAPGTPVSMQVTPAGTNYLWEFLDKPFDSVAVLSPTNAQSTSFTADTPGSYFVRVTVDGVHVAQTIVSVPVTTDVGPVRVPAAGETFEVDSQKGWARAVQLALRLAAQSYNMALQAIIKKSFKDAVRAVQVVGDGNILMTAPVPLSLDGVPIVDGDRVLLRVQTLGQENGIYDYTDDGVDYVLTRSTDADTEEKLLAATVPVLEGATYQNYLFMQTVDAPIVVDTTPLVFTVVATSVTGVTVPSGSASLVNTGPTRVLRWTDGGTYEVELT